MAKNTHRNKKRVAQKKQERLTGIAVEREAVQEEHNPWKDLRREIENRKEKPTVKQPEVGASRPGSKKYNSILHDPVREEKERLEREKYETEKLEWERRDRERNTVTERKYMYDSARPADDDKKLEAEKETVPTEKPDDTEKKQEKKNKKQGEGEPEEDGFEKYIVNRKRPRLSKKFKRIIAVTVSFILICALAVGFLGFKFMVKYGSLKYLYNYFNKTQGSLRYETDLSAIEDADSDVPRAVPETDPAKKKVKEKIEKKGKITDSVERLEQISFNTEKSTDAPISGFFTFRGNYRRDASSVGSVSAKERVLENTWSYETGKLLKNNGSDYWSGNGWTGQPLLAQWEDSTRGIMNMYENAKEKSGLVEVIYPGMDGRIHFLDLDTGEQTRPDINVGMTFKGTASIYPNGIPLLFCGCGDAQTGPFGENVSQRFYIYSLIDGSLLYEGGIDDSFAPRRWHAYDSSPVIDPETDTLIYPGENGVIYTLKLNTDYRKEYGTISVKPDDLIKYTFTIDGVYGENSRVWGSECSACAWNGYIFLGDNAGMFYCLDINTMKMVWLTDLKEDINSSPILSFEEDGKFIYIGTTLKYGYDEHSMGEAAVYKLNAITGRTVWKKGYQVHTVKGYAGGVLSTGAVGKGEIGDFVIYSVSKTPSLEEGYLVALNKKTGHEDWRITLDMYSWSSTILTYDRDGMPLIIQGCQNGDLLLIDARDGNILNRINFGSAIEATPVMYADRLVIATRGEKIYGARLR